MFSVGKYKWCFKVQIRYFVLCFVNCRVLKKIRGHVWVFVFLSASLPPDEKEDKKNQVTPPISIALHWWFSPSNDNYSQNIPHECWVSWCLAAKRELLTARIGAELFIYNLERELHKYMNLGLHALRCFILTSRTHKQFGTSVVVQGLRPCAHHAGSQGLILVWELDPTCCN